MPASVDDHRPLRAYVAELAARAWPALLQAVRETAGSHLAPFPPPPLREQEEGNLVLLPGVEHPHNSFEEICSRLSFVGTHRSGFYYVELGEVPPPFDEPPPPSPFDRLYGALQRWAAECDAPLPERFTVLGRLTVPRLRIPVSQDMSSEERREPSLGWQVQPLYLHVDESVLVLLDSGHPHGASYLGEPAGTLPPWLPRPGEVPELPPEAGAPATRSSARLEQTEPQDDEQQSPDGEGRSPGKDETEQEDDPPLPAGIPEEVIPTYRELRRRMDRHPGAAALDELERRVLREELLVRMALAEQVAMAAAQATTAAMLGGAFGIDPSVKEQAWGAFREAAQAVAFDQDELELIERGVGRAEREQMEQLVRQLEEADWD